MARKKNSSGRFALGLVVGLVLAGVGVVVYFKFVAPKAVTVSKPVPFEKDAAPLPASTTHADHQVKTAPFGTSEDVFEAGAHVYKSNCASCHGTPGHDAAFARYMDPTAPQLWKKHTHGNVVGVSDDAAGETYGKVANGIPQSGMPAYQHVLSETQMWQVSLLLKNADQQLPDPVMAILDGAK